jgi:hypothetical protein
MKNKISTNLYTIEFETTRLLDSLFLEPHTLEGLDYNIGVSFNVDSHCNCKEDGCKKFG